MSSDARLRVDDDIMAAALEELVGEIGRTPRRLFLDELANGRFRWVARRSLGIAKLTPAYSVKTNPRIQLLAAARRSGLFAEVISDGELERAIAQGFDARSIIYNGPLPLSAGPVYCVFVDSLEAYGRYRGTIAADVFGVRYRPWGIDSRFGVTADKLAQCALIARSADNIRSIGLSFHVRPTGFASRTWDDIAVEALKAAVQFEVAATKPLEVLDVGGGWTPDGMEAAFDAHLPRFAESARAALAALERIIIEPGQSLVTPCEAVAARIVELRAHEQRTEGIVDAGYPDLPQARAFEHRIFYVDGNRAVRLPRGRWRIGGCTCLEYDIIADGIGMPDHAKVGDVLIVCDTGAYDASMAFHFAQGVRSRIE